MITQHIVAHKQLARNSSVGMCEVMHELSRVGILSYSLG